MSTNCGSGVSAAATSAAAASGDASPPSHGYGEASPSCSARPFRLLPFFLLDLARDVAPALVELLAADAFEQIELACGFCGPAEPRERGREGVSRFVPVGHQFECPIERGHRFLVAPRIKVKLADSGVGLRVARVDEHRRHQLAERVVRMTLGGIRVGELFVDVRIVRIEPRRLGQCVDGAVRIALDLREPRDGDQQGAAPDERAGERGLIFTPRVRDPVAGFVTLSARKMCDRRVAGLLLAFGAIRPLERRDTVTVLFRRRAARNPRRWRRRRRPACVTGCRR